MNRAAWSIVLTLAGCASHTGVVQMGRDTYMVAKQAATGFPGLGNMKAEIISEAAAHCASMSRELRILSSKETAPPYILGNYPRAEVTFACLPPPPPPPEPPAPRSLATPV